MRRRTFLQISGVGVGTFLAAGRPAPIAAAPPEDNDYLKVIPADKNLDPDWVASLHARGEPTVYGTGELEFIGMPIGGICSGMVYLGGDGRLWRWDIFNQLQEGVVAKTVDYAGSKVRARDGANYVRPAEPESPFEIGFGIRVETPGASRVRRLDRTGFSDVSFRGEYPIGRVAYGDRDCPVSVELEAFSPFIPLNVDDSSLPATVMSYRVRNGSSEPVTVQLAGWLENAVCLESKDRQDGVRLNRIVGAERWRALSCTAAPRSRRTAAERPDIPFEDFESAKYTRWSVEGTAFGDGPIQMNEMPSYQGRVGGQGERVVNSHNVRQGEDVSAGDRHTGTLTSEPFTIERNYISFLIGGGSHSGKTCINLVVGDNVERSATGHDDNRMRRESFDVRPFQEKQARLEIVDAEGGGWGNIGIDDIVFSDRPPDAVSLEERRDFGSMALLALDATESDQASASVKEAGVFGVSRNRATRPLGEKLVGSVGRSLHIDPGGEETVTFVVAWHFPNLNIPRLGKIGQHYASRFDSALSVARYVAEHFERLRGTTRLWRDTWYDSTLPYWFLDRTMANATTLATTTCFRGKDGRFWAWEGIGCCPGTCTHVWHYAQAVARLFPEIERDQRQRVDYGLAFNPRTGVVAYRGEWHDHDAHDGQAGTILRAYREHLTSHDAAFLGRNWERIRQSIDFLIGRDGDEDGIIEGAQSNTLDAAWFGKIPSLASLYIAALGAGEAMATDIGDVRFADRCRRIAARGAVNILELFNGEYFVQKEDPQHTDAIGVGTGCYIDQVFGQGWAFQVGLGRLFDEKATHSALRSLWRYNFVPDVGTFRDKFRRGRWYAVAGEAGLLMCTWPRGGKRADWEKHWQYMYFNECMSGFEWQVAAHMIWEGMVEEGLAVARAIHDRYHAARRNPYNEVECSDHYARAMASYGAFVAACGFEYHGPKGEMTLSPRLSPRNFKAAFTAAAGWGSFEQRSSPGKLEASVTVRYGHLTLRQLTVALPDNFGDDRVAGATVNGAAGSFEQRGRGVTVRFEDAIRSSAGQTLSINLTS